MTQPMTQKQIKRALERYARKYVGLTFRAVYIDGEFAGILPEDPDTGEVTTDHPSVVIRKVPGQGQ